jgi:DNA-3-methyladenine glycosylase II
MVEVQCKGPYDLALSLRAARSFARRARSGGAGGSSGGEPAQPGDEALRLGVWLNGRPTLLEARQTHFDPPIVAVVTLPLADQDAVSHLATRILNADMELDPFYGKAADDPVLGPLTSGLRGLKPFRPASLFDMLVMAVTEQQISLLAAQRIQARLIEHFGTTIEDQPVFPLPRTLAEASPDDLVACGLSHRKAEYVIGAAEAIVAGTLDLAALEAAPEDDVRERISALRGFGAWSADYVLIRGMGRPDVVPWDDLGVRKAVSEVLGRGRTLTPADARSLLAPFTPYRGLATFYLLVASRKGSADSEKRGGQAR